MFPLMVSGEVAPKAYADGPSFSMPVSMLLELHNALPEDHPMRTVVVDYIGAFGSANNKSHWTRGVVRKDDGSLVFDKALYRVAVYRGKQETRMSTSAKAFADLRQELDFLVSFHEEENALTAQLAVAGEALLALPERSGYLHHILEHADQLKLLAEDMRCGLANNLAGTTERALEQKLQQEALAATGDPTRLAEEPGLFPDPAVDPAAEET